MTNDNRAVLSELLARTGDARRGVEREAARLADLAERAFAVAEQRADDPRLHAHADRIARTARSAAAQLRDAADGLDHIAFQPTQRANHRRDTAG